MVILLKKKAVLTLVVFIFLFILYTIWNNILILDDFHPSNEDLYVISEGIQDKFTESCIRKEGYHIYINLDELKLYLYKDGILVKTYMVSGGKPETPSPEGTWKIISKSAWAEALEAHGWDLTYLGASMAYTEQNTLGL